MPRVLITGDRNWICTTVAERIVRSLRDRHGTDLVVVHGAARGVDSAFSAACTEFEVAQEPHPADWEGLGKAAGVLRNQAMVDLGAAFAIALHRNLAASKGTKDCVRRCLAAGIAVWLVDGVNPDRRLEQLPDPAMGCPVCDGPAVHRGGKFWGCPQCDVEFKR